ncbi:MAG: hypothetical protein QOE01_1450 [Actinomycetota bacterium]|nr:hypothetical protein [Actinomycetota bacterium]MDQ1616544.1 hypothetical protein [Actinomycetota bacterium]
MRRHELDLVSLIAGVLFCLVSAALLVSVAADSQLNARWLAPTLLVGLGALGLAGALGGRRDGRDRSALSSDEAPVTSGDDPGGTA